MKIDKNTLITFGAIVGALVLVGLVVSGLSKFIPELPDSRPGSSSYYERIDNMRDCVKLQEEFDRAMNRHNWRSPGDSKRQTDLTYAEYADERMKKVGCYR